MPPVRSVAISDSALSLTDLARSRTFVFATLPGTENTPAKAEAFINGYLRVVITEYQVVVHVFAIAPLRLTVMTADRGVTIPDTWWVD